MEFTKKFLSLILIFSLTTSGVSFAEVPDPDEIDENVNPFTENPPGTASGIKCSTIDEKPSSLGVCCVGLEKNGSGICDEPAYSDPALVNCSSNGDCSGGTGCYSQRAGDLFSVLSLNSEGPEIKKEKSNEIMSQVTDEGSKSAGSSCVHARECASYACAGGVCQDKKVCRFAAEGEVAASGVNCGGKDVIKNANGVCTLSPDAKNAVYLGLLKEATLDPVGKCQFELSEETRKKSMIAMKSLRAMEWFLSSITLSDKDECFKVMPLLKDQIGISFRDTRKTILSNFTNILNEIEYDYKQMIEAKEKSDKMLSIHKGESISEGDLATRQTSGYDTLMIMYRRNYLFKAYEKAMLETVKVANTKVSGLSQSIGSWNGGASSWKIGDETVSAYNCEGSKYKKRSILTWKTKYYNTVRDRWANYFEVTGDALGNSDVVKREGVSKILALIGGTDEAQAIAEFSKPKYYLMDPMMFGGTKQGSYGQEKKLKKKSGFLGIFGGFKDLRHAYYIKGDAGGSYTKMHSDLKPALEQYYRSMKKETSQKGFVYEPELLTTEAKDCLDNPEKPENCKDFQSFMDDIRDEAFAQFLAFSYSTESDYANFFTNASSYRRRFLAKLEVDMQNIQKYYETIIDHRDKQNACIEKVMNGLVTSEILASGENGIKEGGIPIKGTTGVSIVNGSVNSLATNKKVSAGNKLDALDRSKFQFDLLQNSQSLSSQTVLDNISSSNSSSSVAGVGNSSGALLAMRGRAMRRANEKAQAAGVNLAAKEKAISSVIDSMTKKTTSSASKNGINGSSTSSSLSIQSEKPKTGSAPTNGGVAGEGVNVKNEVTLEGKKESISQQPGSMIPFTESKDGTGLSDSEKERLLSEYEKNREQYENTEGDELFKKVSKAYVRNLDKVLNKKKKLD